MANKFTRSVQERQEKEEQRRQQDFSLQQQESNSANSIKPDKDNYLSAFLDKKQRRTAKNKTFYLDEAVIYAIKKNAEKEMVTESKLVNDILRKVLILR